MKKILVAAFLWATLGLTGAVGQKTAMAENRQPGASQSILEEASLLLTKSSQSASAGQRAEAAEAAQAAVGVLRGGVPPADEQTAYLALLTQALETWTVRLIEAGHLDEAAKVAHETLQAARQAAEAPGADVNAIASLIMALSRQLSGAGLNSEGLEAAQVAADLPQEDSERRKAWGTTMSQKPLPKTGCFSSAYPNTEVQEVPCVKAPQRPY